MRWLSVNVFFLFFGCLAANVTDEDEAGKQEYEGSISTKTKTKTRPQTRPPTTTSVQEVDFDMENSYIGNYFAIVGLVLLPFFFCFCCLGWCQNGYILFCLQSHKDCKCTFLLVPCLTCDCDTYRAEKVRRQGEKQARRKKAEEQKDSSSKDDHQAAYRVQVSPADEVESRNARPTSEVPDPDPVEYKWKRQMPDLQNA